MGGAANSTPPRVPDSMATSSQPPRAPPAGAGEAVGAARLPDIPLEQRPTCLICLGMAGSGKTTFVQVTHAGRTIV